MEGGDVAVVDDGGVEGFGCTQGTVLISIPSVDVYQLDGSTAQPTLLSSYSTLTLKLVDIPSNVLISIPSQSGPPSYFNCDSQPDSGRLTNNHPQCNPTVVNTWLVISVADGLIEIPLSSDSLPCFLEPRSYIIPILPGDQHQQLASDSLDKTPSSINDGAQIRLIIGDSVDEDSLDTFDSILAGWTAYNGRNKASSTADQKNGFVDEKQEKKNQPEYDKNLGRLAFVDEKTGEICGELESDIVVSGVSLAGSHQPPLTPSSLVASSEPVLISLSQPTSNGTFSHAEVTPLSPDSRSMILSGADWVSRGILTGSEKISQFISQSGTSYISRSKPSQVNTPISPATRATTEKIVGYTQSAAKFSGKAARVVGSVAGKVGDSIGKTTGIQRGPRGEIPTGARGYAHKGIMAFSTVMDSLEAGGKKILYTAGDTTTNVVTHSYGPEAGAIAGRANEGVRNVALVYIDVRGVSRKAILKSAGKAAIKGRTKDGREFVFKATEDGEGGSKENNGHLELNREKNGSRNEGSLEKSTSFEGRTPSNGSSSNGWNNQNGIKDEKGKGKGNW
ncbi:senescence-associated protein-domain-containing protein [Phakopsora pachyrhizi]|uniref:Senescence-associated protein-domain-containing protein n=1 Tax=Phakopsora pachyrhizi TaxID=170000 RepID=A0AAV0B0H2_PHAPC|nr:senescence-associated protein-domain-containing protein [Phakopsora pachyrhizi]